jgi:hypothetical protein
VGRRPLIAGCLAGAVVALVAIGSALGAVSKGAKYSGFVTPTADNITISWKVSSSGKKVSGIKLSAVPQFCAGSGERVSATFKSASVKSSRFSSTATTKFKSGPDKGEPQYRLKLKARFTSTKNATGTITVDWLGSDKSCDGQSSFFAGPR